MHLASGAELHLHPEQLFHSCAAPTVGAYPASDPVKISVAPDHINFLGGRRGLAHRPSSRRLRGMCAPLRFFVTMTFHFSGRARVNTLDYTIVRCTCSADEDICANAIVAHSPGGCREAPRAGGGVVVVRHALAEEGSGAGDSVRSGDGFVWTRGEGLGQHPPRCNYTARTAGGTSGAPVFALEVRAKRFTL